MASTSESNPPWIRAPVQLPRITIKFCTQCKWMLRAAYFAQELLSTFSTSLGEVSLVPTTGGVFTVDLVHSNQPPDHQQTETNTQTTRLWDRKTEGGFPEVKHLKQLVRDIIDPTRDLGHVDRHRKEASPLSTAGAPPENSQAPPQNSDKSKQSGGHSAEGTIATDPDAAVARGTPEGEAKGEGRDETCEDCG